MSSELPRLEVPHAWDCASTDSLAPCDCVGGRLTAALQAVLDLHYTRGRNILGDPVCNECADHGPNIGPCVDIGDGITLKPPEARQLAAAVRKAAGPDTTPEEVVWLGWAAAFSLSFAALEIAMPTKLSTVLRKHLRIAPQRAGHRIAGTTLALSAAWVISHLLDEHDDG